MSNQQIKQSAFAFNEENKVPAHQWLVVSGDISQLSVLIFKSDDIKGSGYSWASLFPERNEKKYIKVPIMDTVTKKIQTVEFKLRSLSLSMAHEDHVVAVVNNGNTWYLYSDHVVQLIDLKTISRESMQPTVLFFVRCASN